MNGKGKKAVSRVRKPSHFARLVALIEEARQKVATVANIAQVYTNYEIGRQIVEEEQGGKRRADYGKKVLIDLSSRLTSRFGRGFSVDNLQNMRSFYLVYSAIEIHETPSRKSSVDQALVEMFTPDSEKNRIFVKQYTSVLPSKAALKRIVIEEKRKFEKERLLALAAREGGGA